MIIHSAFYAMLENTSDMIFVKNNNFEMNTRAKLSFYTVNECRVVIKIFSKYSSGFFCMNQTDLYAVFYQVGKYFKQGFCFFSVFYIKVLNVCCTNPQDFFYRFNAFYYCFIVSFIGNKLKR